MCVLGIHFVGESVINVNLIMNIHRCCKSGCAITINGFKSVSSGSKCTIQILAKLPGNGYRNGTIGSQMLDYRIQCEGHWIKAL